MAAQPDQQQRVLVALLNRASTSHRLTILDQLVSSPSSPFELLAERSLRISLPEDDELLRSLLATEIETQGEAETLVRWALKFTATTNYFIALKLKSASEESICDLFLRDHAPGLWDTYGQDEIYVSPDPATAEMQIELLFPECIDKEQQSEPVSVPAATQAAPMTPTASTSSEGGSGSGFSQASVLSSASTAASSTRPQSRASLVHPSSTAFKARAIPSTVKSRPSIEPRLSRAAALRMGVQLPDSPARSASRNTSPAKDADANKGISGVVKRPVAPPVSLKAPTIAPRLNKAALARQGGAIAPESAQRPASVAGHAFPAAAERKPVDFSNTPGHKRLSLAGQSSIASIAPPSIAPRQNRASMSRIQNQTAQPVSASPRTATGAAAAPPSSFRAAGAVARARSSSVTSSSSSAASAQTAAKTEERERKPIDFATTPGHKRASLSLSIASLAAPSVQPRQNRASLARARPSLSGVGAASPRAPLAKPLPNAPAAESGGGGKENAPRPTTTAADYTAVPGHKRASLQFSLASLRAPSIAPRLNKAAGARIGVGKGSAK